MASNDLSKPPFIYFGGKSKIASTVWELFGNVKNYVEPFAGSLAVLRLRPTWHFDGSVRVETVNDLDYFITNFWRAVQQAPEEVAKWANNPIIEADLHARHKWLVEIGKPELASKMHDDPDYYNAKIAGWWVWGINAWIGKGWCQDANRQLPHLGNTGKGVNRQLPHLGDTGKGVNRQLPNLKENLRHQAHLDNLTSYFQAYADRLRYVRITNGSWERVMNAAVTAFNDSAIFLDPPYPKHTSKDMYASDHTSDVGYDAMRWAVENGNKHKIVLCGYRELFDAEIPDGWQRIGWKANAAYKSKKENRFTETLWASPLCNQLSNSELFK